MRVNIYYGGRGLIEDPTIYVINKMMEVLTEIRVEVTKYNLYEEKNNLSTLPKTLKEADAVILATTVEWLGIGGYMQQFLDACWLYGDKEKISTLYMLPVVMSTTYGEREANLTLIEAWEMLGGIPYTGLSAYVDNHVEFETNPDYAKIIEKKAEDLYRTVNQKVKTLPSSNSAVKQNILRNNSVELTPQESEQLSVYISDDSYVKQQKEDIEELSQLFKGMLNSSPSENDTEYIDILKKNFYPEEKFAAKYSLFITGVEKSLIIEVNDKVLKCYYGEIQEADVSAKLSKETMNNILKGEMSFQKAFMSGELTAKGNFKILRTFDNIFRFE